MSYKSDFHIHSYFSDGKLKPTELVSMYKEKDYDMISITDHDNIDGVNEAMIAGEALKIKVLPGIEFATRDDEDNSIHILGYNFDIEDDDFLDKIRELKKFREERNEKLLIALNEMGYELTKEDLIFRKKQKFIGKPHFAQALLDKGYTTDFREAFQDGKFLESEKVRNIRRKTFITKDSIELLNNAGGMAVVAHPMKIKSLGAPRSDDFFSNLDKLIGKLKKCGLKGLECYHPSATEEDSLKLVNIAGKYHLHITEGSDFHGDHF